jgi:hypothetical protein
MMQTAEARDELELAVSSDRSRRCESISRCHGLDPSSQRLAVGAAEADPSLLDWRGWTLAFIARKGLTWIKD